MNTILKFKKVLINIVLFIVLLYIIPSFVYSQLECGPLIGHTTDTTAKIWVAAGQGKSVEYRYRPTSAAVDEAVSVSAAPRAEWNYTSLADLTGLKPTTEYIYEVLVDGIKVSENSFTTAPKKFMPGEFSFVVGSCARTQAVKVQPVWDAIIAEKPDLMFLIGDNVYTGGRDRSSKENIWSRYMTQFTLKNFAQLLQTTPTYSTWDDHDYGANDATSTEPDKVITLWGFKSIYANPQYAAVGDTGVYHSFYWGDVHFIFLDNRWHRTPWVNDSSYIQFGLKQMDWLLNELGNSKGIFKVIATGGNLGSDYETNLIYDFIIKNKIYGVVWTSGDKHSSEIKVHNEKIGYPLTEIISSGLAFIDTTRWFVMVDINTKVSDPTLNIRVFSQDIKIEEKQLKLSELTPSGVTTIPQSKKFIKKIEIIDIGGRYVFQIKNLNNVKSAEIIDLYGRTVAKPSVIGNKIIWDGKNIFGKNLIHGMYLLKVDDQHVKKSFNFLLPKLKK